MDYFVTNDLRTEKNRMLEKYQAHLVQYSKTKNKNPQYLGKYKNHIQKTWSLFNTLPYFLIPL